MNIKIHSVVGKGDLDKELTWLQVLADVSDLSFYMVCDTTYKDNNSISNELRHIYWLPKQSVKQGDWIAVHTKDGKNTTVKNEQGTTTHHFYWNLGRTIWNKDGDCAVLFNLNSWTTHPARSVAQRSAA
ncbi:MAG TPA: hypothetical protein VEM96_00835 [Pyrinomonadaceae bacterium]|nr:hypothetical protein [Pyrinomonadaceae bacterium]